MASLSELELAIGAQGALVKQLKTDRVAKEETDAAVAKLLELKTALSVLAPDHALAIVDKKKKAAKPGGGVPPEKGAKDKKAERLALRTQQQLQAEQATAAAAEASDNFGELEIVMSRALTERSWTHVRALDASLAGRPVLCRGRVHAVRAKGSLAFLVLRQGCFTAQCIASVGEGGVTKAMVAFIGRLFVESIVDVEAVVVAAGVSGCTQGTCELQLRKIHIVSKAAPDLPFQLADAARNENDAEDGLVTVGLDTRLDNRVIDLRTPANQAIVRIRSATLLMFGTFLDSKGFVGVNTPKLLAGATEGGSSVFKLDYFGKPCCLAQSPQLYKQMLSACADFERIYEIGPVFRAENSNTRRHLCEFTGLDFEMSIYEHYYEVLQVFGELFSHMFTTIETKFKAELEIISQVYPFQPFKHLKHPLRLTFAEGIALLRGAGVTEEMQGSFDDLSTANEKTLGDLVLAKYDTDFFMMDKYPLSIRPFYTMPDPETFGKVPCAETLSNSFDMFMRGQEIVSGAQRVHDHALLLERIKYCHEHAGGPAPHEVQGYTDAFKFGAFPHGGGGVGLERVVMLYLGLGNIRKVSCFPRDPTRLTP
ncbi:hypothetical protein M885DRAFT_539552 [Pelagophyceae sp. CCMP2097]|nr:hypothetical protein M885DRAFT_539552 [Pelagophyceae sp. CCMP2097]